MFPKPFSFVTGASSSHPSTTSSTTGPAIPKPQSKPVASSDLTSSQQIFLKIIKQGYQYFILFVLLLKLRFSKQINEPTKAAEIKNLLKQSSTFPAWLRSRQFMAGTLCLADVQLTAFQAYKKLIRLKIESVTINCQAHCQHFQPRSASCTSTGNSGYQGNRGGEDGAVQQDLVWVGRVIREGS